MLFRSDYIGELAASVKTTDDDFWHDTLKRWLVGMVAGATQSEAVNQHALMLYSRGQGVGKSTWVKRLLPPELTTYQRTGAIDFNNKDHAMLLSTHLLINLDEFDGVRRDEVAALKRILTQSTITERKVYATQMKQYARHASFIGSTNNRHCLQDMEGNRRFLISTVNYIDLTYHVHHAGLYAQAMQLLHNGFQYWYAGGEIDALNARNEAYRQKDSVEELFYVRYAKSVPPGGAIKWLSAGHIASQLSITLRTPMNIHTQHILTRLLDRDGFVHRRGTNGQTEYAVFEKD